MPELPEVETIRSQLNLYLPLRIKQTQFFPKLKKILHTKAPSNLTYSKLIQIDRYGKALIFRFDKNFILFSQLGMSGGWRIAPSTSFIMANHTHFLIEGIHQRRHYTLSYVDPRRFGRLSFWSEEQLEAYLDKMGVDVCSNKLTADYIVSTLQHYPKRTIKKSLLDQALFAGVGNYLANEICAHARILPTRTGQEIKSSDGPKLLQAFQKALNTSIQNQGMTFHGGYLDTTGSRGSGATHLVVFYQKICQICHKTAITKIYLDGRGTYFCPHCQS